MFEEKKLAICRPHWTGFIGQGILCTCFVILAVIFLIVPEAIAELETNTAHALVIISLVIAAIIALRIFISIKFTYLELTETKLIGHKGFIKSKTLTTPLSRVQDVGISNGLFGKIFGYHTISISSAGTAGTEFVFKNMANARAFSDAVQNAIAVMR